MPPAITLDLHVHTDYSHNGHDSVAKIIESAIAQKLDGIAICDHDTMDGSYAARFILFAIVTVMCIKA